MSGKMRVDKETYEEIKKFFSEGVTKEMVEMHREWVREDRRVKDLEMRVRWDCYWWLRKKNPALAAIVAKLYESRSFTDDHLDTVLRKVMKELNFSACEAGRREKDD